MHPRASVAVLAVLVASALIVSGCGADPREQYARSTVAIINEWHAIVDRWNASPGSAAVATDFVSLEARAKAIVAPSGMEGVHKLLLTAMEAERTSFEMYARGKKAVAEQLHPQALRAMDSVQQALRDLGLIK